MKNLITTIDECLVATNQTWAVDGFYKALSW